MISKKGGDVPLGTGQGVFLLFMKLGRGRPQYRYGGGIFRGYGQGRRQNLEEIFGKTKRKKSTIF